MLYFFDEDTCKKTYKEMEHILMNKSLEEVWKVACTYAEHYVHTQQQNAFAESVISSCSSLSANTKTAIYP
ncbi:MAG: hypothetical protein LC106_06900 [Burkholderiales bacterium]|nr:hypothetical protein [Burkholderiales bacterium]